MPENTVYVGRPTVFGNYHSGSRWDDDDWALGAFPTWKACVVECYRRWLIDDPAFMGWWRYTVWGCLELMAGDPARAKLLDRLPELRGKHLACWCSLNEPCHADVLLELANGHLSDCAVHRAPAYEPGPCDCGAAVPPTGPMELGERPNTDAAQET